MMRRFLVPSFITRALYFFRFRAFISPRAEVEYSPLAAWGERCVISSFTKVKIAGPFIMGHRVQIATSCFITAQGPGIELGDDVLIGPNCTIVCASYVYDIMDMPLQLQGTTSHRIRIGRNTWIGANTVVLGGADIGENAIISAGSVVSGKIPPNAIAQGNPARVIFTRR